MKSVFFHFQTLHISLEFCPPAPTPTLHKQTVALVLSSCFMEALIVAKLKLFPMKQHEKAHDFSGPALFPAVASE